MGRGWSWEVEMEETNNGKCRKIGEGEGRYQGGKRKIRDAIHTG